MTLKKQLQRKRRHGRIRSTIKGTAETPRLTVFRSNTSIYAQLIDDSNAVTLGAASDLGEKTGTKVERAHKVGAAIAKIAQDKNISKVVFDRGGFKYTGRVAAVAEGAREAGLTF